MLNVTWTRDYESQIQDAGYPDGALGWNIGFCRRYDQFRADLGDKGSG